MDTRGKYISNLLAISLGFNNGNLKPHENKMIMDTIFLKEKERTFQYRLWYIERPSVWSFLKCFIDNN